MGYVRGRKIRSFTPSLTHEATETLEGSGDTNVGVDLDKHASCSVDVDLEQPSLIQGRVEEGEQALRQKSAQRQKSRGKHVPGE